MRMVGKWKPIARHYTRLHGLSEDISLAADHYSCHSVIEHAREHKITDLADVEPSIDHENGDYIVAEMQLNRPGHFFKKKHSN